MIFVGSHRPICSFKNVNMSFILLSFNRVQYSWVNINNLGSTKNGWDLILNFASICLLIATRFSACDHEVQMYKDFFHVYKAFWTRQSSGACIKVSGIRFQPQWLGQQTQTLPRERCRVLANLLHQEHMSGCIVQGYFHSSFPREWKIYE